MGTWKLKRTIQCAKCPWKTSTNPHDIPGGYCENKHRNLSSTIADPENPYQNIGSDTIQVMACHHSTPGSEEHCVGYLVNQLGVGNNIPLRLHFMSCKNGHEMQVIGEQHERFEDTLPS